MYSSQLNAMDKIYKTQLLNIISSLHKHELLRSQKLLEISWNECTVAFLFLKHALINKGLAPRLFFPRPVSIRFCFHQVEGKVSLLSLPPPFCLAGVQEGARLHPSWDNDSQLWYPKMLRHVVLGLLQQQHALQNGQGFNFMPSWTARIGAGVWRQATRSYRAVTSTSLGRAERAGCSRERHGEDNERRSWFVKVWTSCHVPIPSTWCGHRQHSVAMSHWRCRNVWQELLSGPSQYRK